jgi:hypothetical protein
MKKLSDKVSHVSTGGGASLSEELGKPVAILQDLCGPKIRVGKVPEPGIRLEPGHTFILTNEHVEGTAQRVSVSYLNLPLSIHVKSSHSLATKRDDRQTSFLSVALIQFG